MHNQSKDFQDTAQWKCQFRLEKREGDINACDTPQDRLQWLESTIPYEIIEGEGNLLLNSGIDEIWGLITGIQSGTNRLFSNANAQIGVGDSTTAAAATQTDLLGTNKAYKEQEATFPTVGTQKVTFKSSFGDAEANFAWNEWVVKSVDGTTPTNICLNRKVESLGTKSGGTWTLEVSITLS